jgi:glycosyltransferase involved in cell wall biosynthesis
MTRRGGLLIHCPASQGGIAEYTHYQARALKDLGVDVEVLASPDFLAGRTLPYAVTRALPEAPKGPAGLARSLRHALWLLRVPWILARHVWRTRPGAVLLASYSEYLSPLWIWPHLLLRRALGLRYGANLHDPVRDFQLGPRWWHRLSVALAYRGLDYVIVHRPGPPPGTVPSWIAVYEAPHGIYDLPSSDAPTGRPTVDIPPGARVVLCFGHIRDNKNIDLLIKAIAPLAQLHLVVAGPPPAAGQRPTDFYRALSRTLGVAGRVHILAEHISEADAARLFARADWIATTYAATFLSQSGVLNIAARARKQVLASSGPSPLRAAVERYGLGVFVEPDSTEAIVEGLRALMDNAPSADWEGYERFASWETNARVVLEACGLGAAGQRKT